MKKLSEFFLVIAIVSQSLITGYLFFNSEESWLVFFSFISSLLLISAYMSDYRK